MAKRPSAGSGGGSDRSSCGQSLPLKSSDLVSLANGLEFLGALRASMVWFWMHIARFRRQERLMMRSARTDSIVVAGAGSVRIWSR